MCAAFVCGLNCMIIDNSVSSVPTSRHTAYSSTEACIHLTATCVKLLQLWYRVSVKSSPFPQTPYIQLQQQFVRVVLIVVVVVAQALLYYCPSGMGYYHRKARMSGIYATAAARRAELRAQLLLLQVTLLILYACRMGTIYVYLRYTFLRCRCLLWFFCGSVYGSVSCFLCCVDVAVCRLLSLLLLLLLSSVVQSSGCWHILVPGTEQQSSYYYV